MLKPAGDPEVKGQWEGFHIQTLLAQLERYLLRTYDVPHPVLYAAPGSPGKCKACKRTLNTNLVQAFSAQVHGHGAAPFSCSPAGEDPFA